MNLCRFPGTFLLILAGISLLACSGKSRENHQNKDTLIIAAGDTVALEQAPTGTPKATNPFDFSTLFGGILLGAGLMAGAGYVLVYRKMRLDQIAAQTDYQQARQELESRRKDGGLSHIQLLKLRDYDLICRELQTEKPLPVLQWMKRQVRDWENQASQETGSKPSSVAAAKPSVLPQPALAQPRVAYFSQPNPDGFFPDNQKTDAPTPDSCYKFTLGKNPHQATFRFEAEAGRLQRFLNFRTYFIDPVCESENNFTEGKTHLVMRREGIAHLEGDTWHVDQKALIRFD